MKTPLRHMLIYWLNDEQKVIFIQKQFRSLRPLTFLFICVCFSVEK